MNGTMRAAVLVKPGVIEIQERRIPSAGDDQVLIQVKAVGLCGSDIHYYQHGKIGPYVVEKPIILGHEASGIIVSVGSKVTHLAVGQRVSVEPGAACGRCVHCKTGRYNLCKGVEFLATPPFDGAFCEYIAMRADCVFPVPDSMSDEDAAMMEPFSVGLHATRRGRLQQGETVVIMGMGPIGLVTAAAAKARGAKRIIGVDLEDFRLQTALHMGATHIVNLRKEDLLHKIRQFTHEEGADLAVETAGNITAVQTALTLVKRGGRLAIVGLPPENNALFNVPFIVDNEVDLCGVFRYRNTYPEGIHIVSGGQANLRPMVTHRMSLNDTRQAFEQAITDKGNTIKIVIHP